MILGAFGRLGATLGAPLGDLGGHRGRLWDAKALHRGSLEALQDRLGISLGHPEAPGVDLGGFLLPKLLKMLTVVGIHDAASRIPTTVVMFPPQVTTVVGSHDAAS